MGGAVFYLAKVTCVMYFEIRYDDNPTINKILQDDILSTAHGVTLTKHHHIRAYGRLGQDSSGRWIMAHQHETPDWVKAVDLGRDRDWSHPSPSRQVSNTPVKIVVNLVLDPPGNVVIMTTNLHVYISASLGYHMRFVERQDGGLDASNGTPVYTLKENEGLQGLPRFAQGSIRWGPGAVTRASLDRLVFNKRKVIPQGRNLFHNQPIETISNIIDTLQPTKGNMNLMQLWKQVCRGWWHHINTYTYPDNHWQRNLRTEMGGIWKSLHARAMPIALIDKEDPHLEPRIVPLEFIADLCTTMDKYSPSRALVGGVASIISILAHTNDHLLETLGANSGMEPSPFSIGRQELQSHLTESLLRHGLAQTPWHSDRTGPWGIAPEILGQARMDVLPRMSKRGIIEPAASRTEAHRRGYDILQILQALLDIGNPTERDIEIHRISPHE